LAAAISHWNLARDLAAQIRETPVGGMAHACEYETSWYLFLDPENVQMELATPDVMARRTSFTWVDLMGGEGPVAFTDDWSRISNGSGVEGDPMTATIEKGRHYAEEEVNNLVRFCEEFKGLPTLPRRNYTARGQDANPYYQE
jgi:creatinine amidohydrolase